MASVKDGSTVKVHYTGKLEDGTVFDSSLEREPLEFKIGAGSIIPGFEKGIMGLETGAKKTLTIAPEDGYGDPSQDLIAVVKKTEFPKDITPELGQQLQMQRPDGQIVNMVISQIDGDDVTLDANHPLAGKTLIFDIELVEVA